MLFCHSKQRKIGNVPKQSCGTAGKKFIKALTEEIPRIIVE